MSIPTAEIRDKFQKVLDHAKQEFASLRTGRATVQMLDSVRVMAYGSSLAIHEVASVSAPDATLLVVKPWDKGLLADIEKAIQVAQLNLNPVVDADMIRIAVPPLTQERRQEMVKVLAQKLEEVKIMLRNARSDFRRDIDKQKGEAGVSEDDIENDQNDLDALMKEYAEELEAMAASKEKELTTI